MLLNAIPLPPVTAIEEVNVMLQTDSYAEAFKLEQKSLEESSSAQTDATERMTHFGARWPTKKRMPVRLTSSEDEQDEGYQVHASGSTHERSFSVSECAVPIPPEPLLKRMVSTPINSSPKQATLAQSPPTMSCSGTQAPNNEAAWLASINGIAGTVDHYFKTKPPDAMAALEKRLIHVETALNALTDKIQSMQTQTATTSRRIVPVTLRTINSTSELNLCEQQLEDAQYYEAVVTQLSRLGGTDLRNFLRRILSSVFSVTFSKQLNWSGIHGKHQASQLKITKAITDRWNTWAEIKSQQKKNSSKTDHPHGQ
ncbi:hypothetical protein EG68_09034 [Paragonimus skrjabini miyazakii]|uniref:DUF4806 domain-containing protein n=1 Tax=Paragonimus skrjabini miyazakii TaxID=59628 RepID=A0A8S9YPB4_9TREM|nr:hypothetical protein EG68_09034 [Paragonimus skrjabini miyazakii]